MKKKQLRFTKNLRMLKLETYSLVLNSMSESEYLNHKLNVARCGYI